MAKKKAKTVARRSSPRSGSSLDGLFKSHPNLKMLLGMFTLAVILWVLTYQM